MLELRLQILLCFFAQCTLSFIHFPYQLVTPSHLHAFTHSFNQLFHFLFSTISNPGVLFVSCTWLQPRSNLGRNNIILDEAYHNFPQILLAHDCRVYYFETANGYVLPSHFRSKTMYYHRRQYQTLFWWAGIKKNQIKNSTLVQSRTL